MGLKLNIRLVECDVGCVCVLMAVGPGWQISFAAWGEMRRRGVFQEPGQIYKEQLLDKA